MNHAVVNQMTWITIRNRSNSSTWPRHISSCWKSAFQDETWSPWTTVWRVLWIQLLHLNACKPVKLIVSDMSEDMMQQDPFTSYVDLMCVHVGHVLCKQYGFTAAEFLPLHLVSFSNRLCWIWTEQRPKGRLRTPLYVDVCLAFTVLSFIEKWSLQKEMQKQHNLWCGIRGRDYIRNRWHSSVNNDTL